MLPILWGCLYFMNLDTVQEKSCDEKEINRIKNSGEENITRSEVTLFKKKRMEQ